MALIVAEATTGWYKGLARTQEPSRYTGYFTLCRASSAAHCKFRHKLPWHAAGCMFHIAKDAWEEHLGAMRLQGCHDRSSSHTGMPAEIHKDLLIGKYDTVGVNQGLTAMHLQHQAAAGEATPVNLSAATQYV